MNKKMKWIAALVAVTASVSMADINLTFSCANSVARTYTPAGGNITLDFSVDGAGAVTMTTGTTAIDANFIADVASWAGSVGTVDVGLAGQTFQITLGNIETVDRTSLLVIGSERVSLQTSYGGIMGSGGGNGGRIDWTSGAQEVFHVTQTGGTAWLQLLDIDWHSNTTVTDLSDTQIIAYNTDENLSNLSFYNLPSNSGTLDLSANNLLISGDLTLRQPLDGSHGLALQGMTIRVIPEPATIGMLGLGAIATLMIRRFRNRA